MDNQDNVKITRTVDEMEVLMTLEGRPTDMGKISPMRRLVASVFVLMIFLTSCTKASDVPDLYHNQRVTIELKDGEYGLLPSSLQTLVQESPTNGSGTRQKSVMTKNEQEKLTSALNGLFSADNKQTIGLPDELLQGEQAELLGIVGLLFEALYDDETVPSDIDKEKSVPKMLKPLGRLGGDEEKEKPVRERR
ncbi:MAG: hypothetical protein NUV74_12925 [Candidatus Brocadiaceae bacterium]|nr:hypothetical protein [Candidatus Brocadiaceae bacterium]